MNPRFMIVLLLLAGCSNVMYEALPTEGNGQYHFEHPGKPAVLVIHGLTATPWEVIGLSVYLTEHNFTVLTPVLEGHGRRPVDLEAASWQDWYGNVNDSYARLAAKGVPVFVIGVSTGGSLALELAKEHELAGLVTVGAPVTLWDERTKYISWLAPLWRYTSRVVLPDEVGHYYPVWPSKSISQLVALIDASLGSASRITEPTLIIQSRDDKTVRPESAQQLSDALVNAPNEIFWVNGTNHVVIREDTDGIVFTKIISFLNEHS
ncbi:alpha/beta fold hydrolase [Candidatus Woesearchaeota archaeon]|nr:alpha/beta fold hydrolase [Candidatus Woesearchaeota archaeon]